MTEFFEEKRNETSMNEPAKKKLPIVRDNNFVRVMADDCFVADLGSSLEIGFIQYGPIFKEYSENGIHETITNQSVLTEVARLRIEYPSAIKMIMRIIENGIKNDALNSQAIISAVEDMSNKHDK